MNPAEQKGAQLARDWLAKERLVRSWSTVSRPVSLGEELEDPESGALHEQDLRDRKRTKHPDPRDPEHEDD